MEKVQVLYTDGSCKANGKENSSGGFGVVGMSGATVVYAYQEKEEITTNNRMEMKAILHAIEHFGKVEAFAQPVIVYSDSRYSVNTFEDWGFKWRANNWIKSDNKIPENLDLIKKYMDFIDKGYEIELRYVKGHNGTLGNELADQLATFKITAAEVMEKYGGK